jgi:hypothetical protein
MYDYCQNNLDSRDRFQILSKFMEFDMMSNFPCKSMEFDQARSFAFLCNNAVPVINKWFMSDNISSPSLFQCVRLHSRNHCETQ